MTPLADVFRRAAKRVLSETLRIVQPYEIGRVRRVSTEQQISPPPLFIVGVPRSGSTVVYQLIANTFDVVYTSNLAALFHHSLAAGIKTHGAVLGWRAFNSFQSHYGTTSSWAEPHECGKFWYRWFPRDRHFVARGELSNASLSEIRSTFGLIASDTGHMMVVKNLNCGQRLQVLAECLPEALIIHVKRDHFESAASILKARLKRRNPDEWWSVMPRSIDSLHGLSLETQVASQVIDLQRQTEQDLTLYPSHQVLEVDYADVCESPEGFLQQVQRFVASNGVPLERRPDAIVPHLRHSIPDIQEPHRSRLKAELRSVREQ